MLRKAALAADAGSEATHICEQARGPTAMISGMSEQGRPFVRLQAAYRGALGVEVGLFVAVDHLRRADRLTEEEEEL